MKILHALVLALACGICGSANAETGNPIMMQTDDGSYFFSMPSKNMECTYTPAHYRGTYRTSDDLAEIQCDRAEPSYVRATMGEELGPTIIKNPGEQPCCSDGPEFAYDHTWKMGAFSCDSLRSGLVCTRNDGHGFRLSRAKAEVF